MSPAEIITAGPIVYAIAIAAGAGLLSFISPCCLPLMPGYLSYITGLTGDQLERGGRKGRVLAGALLFIAGFTFVFTSTVFALQTVGKHLLGNGTTIEVIVGGLMILMGLMFSGLIPFGRGFQIKWRPAAGLTGAPIFGAVFAISWVPCISPVLAAVTGLAYVQGGTTRGLALVIAYCLGLGIPFLLLALGFQKATRAFRFLRSHTRVITAIGGVLLVTVGLMLVTGAWGVFINWLRASVGVGEIWL
ncbi:cytochrome c biogenesis CcdA family protein [Haloglycomyces albus]|uniref:cytochrome c biogenesis CcdA family protein n=1 Tax=Haloglycomyces albus TaxID=526067 RepID=UPI00046D23FF|nr:cytochrome c biogenesis protein CcdA [Haloglycomyces albus]